MQIGEGTRRRGAMGPQYSWLLTINAMALTGMKWLPNAPWPPPANVLDVRTPMTVCTCVYRSLIFGICPILFQVDLRACCPSCLLRFENLRLCEKHLKDEHEHNVGFEVKCLLCAKKLTQVKRWFRHVSEGHSSWQTISAQASAKPSTWTTSVYAARSDIPCFPSSSEGAVDHTVQPDQVFIELRATGVSDTNCTKVAKYFKDYSRVIVQECRAKPECDVCKNVSNVVRLFDNEKCRCLILSDFVKVEWTFPNKTYHGYKSVFFFAHNILRTIGEGMWTAQELKMQG